ncbi:Ig-like domain-containing protein [Leptospira idonii]|uniref:SbsA Ig-like domain-containing protein n=1 Tax=Leptospira idonii TaxID=1193500 RepID=A0A4R9M2F0_9LEPT|nr:Ig-like domain-containing protein [Leptospira idonii]TGN20292.1 hypothetical protein EHS15_03485 [Leptospira idonii]
MFRPLPRILNPAILLMASVSWFVHCTPKPEPFLLGLLVLPTGDTSSVFKVESSAPAKNETGVNTNTNVSIIFSKVVDSSTVNGNIGFTQPSANTISSLSASTSSRTVTIRPNTIFSAASSYTFTIKTGIKSSTGETLSEEYVFTFTTQ